MTGPRTGLLGIADLFGRRRTFRAYEFRPDSWPVLWAKHLAADLAPRCLLDSCAVLQRHWALASSPLTHQHRHDADASRQVRTAPSFRSNPFLQRHGRES